MKTLAASRLVVVNDSSAVGYAVTAGGHVSLSAEASSIGFPPGRWPTPFKCGDELFTLTRGERDRENELVAVHYVGNKGARFVVFND